MNTEKWSVAVFAHNEADNILRCLNSVLGQSETRNFPIYVLANGCSDNTAGLVEHFATLHSCIELVTIEVADKANAWNHYTHHLAPERECHFFVDGDVVVAAGAFCALHEALMASTQAAAAGALPGSGRSRTAWSQRMLSLGRLAGNLYALHGDFIAEIREQGLSIPLGMVGEDFFVTCLAKGHLNLDGLNCPSEHIVFAPEAQFHFDSFSPRQPQHWWPYLNRLIRYQVREYQLLMLFSFMRGRTQQELPADVHTLYAEMQQLPRYRWRGRITPIDMIAVWRIRRAMGRLI